MSWYWAAHEAESSGHVTHANAPRCWAHRIEQRHRRDYCGGGGRLADTIHPPAPECRARRRAALDHLFAVIDAWPREGDATHPDQSISRARTF